MPKPQDTTLRNNRARKNEMKLLKTRVSKLELTVKRLIKRINQQG